MTLEIGFKSVDSLGEGGGSGRVFIPKAEALGYLVSPLWGFLFSLSQDRLLHCAPDKPWHFAQDRLLHCARDNFVESAPEARNRSNFLSDQIPTPISISRFSKIIRWTLHKINRCTAHKINRCTAHKINRCTALEKVRNWFEGWQRVCQKRIIW